MTFFESPSHSTLLLEHDLFRKPVSTFRDHALWLRVGSFPYRKVGQQGAALPQKLLPFCRRHWRRGTGVPPSAQAIRGSTPIMKGGIDVLIGNPLEPSRRGPERRRDRRRQPAIARRHRAAEPDQDRLRHVAYRRPRRRRQ